MYDKLILKDRITTDKFALQIDDREMKFTTDTEFQFSEPILQDEDNSALYWRLFIEDGQMGVESTTFPRNDIIILKDIMTNENCRIRIASGQIYYEIIEFGELPDIILLQSQINKLKVFESQINKRMEKESLISRTLILANSLH